MWSRLFRHGFLVLVGLVAVDLVVRGPVFKRHIGPSFVAAGLLPRDRTNGRTWRAVFEGVERMPRPTLRVGIVGDSTVNGTEALADDTVPAYFLREELRRRFPKATVDVIDVSAIGLYANDAVLLVDKLLTPSYDVVVYGFTMRALPNLQNVRWSQHLTAELSPSEMLRLLALDRAWFWADVPGSDVLGSLVQSVSATYAYRAILKRLLWTKITAPLLSPWPALAEATKPPPFAPPKLGLPRELLPGTTEWTREGYAIPNSNWSALELVARLCERYGAGRCLFYSGPINPLGRDRLVAWDHYEKYRADVRIIAGRYGVRLRDFTDLLDETEFRKPMFPRPGEQQPRDPIHMNVKGAAKLMAYVADTVIDMAQPVLARAAAPTVH